MTADEKYNIEQRLKYEFEALKLQNNFVFGANVDHGVIEDVLNEFFEKHLTDMVIKALNL